MASVGQAARGGRELLPQAAARRRALVDALLGELSRWGYGQVETPLLESFDVVARGLGEADRARCVRFIEAGTGELVTLRADPTPQIAHMIARHSGGELGRDEVLRFCYAADVVRQPASGHEPAEQHQVGVELVGDADPWADVELVALAHAALRCVGLPQVHLDLSHGQLVAGVLAPLQLLPSVAVTVQQALARKDRAAVELALRGAGQSPATARAVASLCDRIGPPAMIERAAAELGAVLPAGPLAALREVVEGVAALGLDAAQLVVDLGETRGLEYYSGVRLRAWAPGVHRPLVRGGRYDHLYARYGHPRPATGFAIDLDASFAALLAAGASLASPPAPAADLVVIPRRADAALRRRAAELAARSRAAGRRAWIQLADDAGAAATLLQRWRLREGEGARATMGVWLDGDDTTVLEASESADERT
ncbi:MAG: ATP phosphoribosyltransferase regulatory subunit [Nannocystaceae bacterium]|nr:ATP phosphoribosyltransferase regulatory subunit [Nannocystaceae bacterium]